MVCWPRLQHGHAPCTVQAIHAAVGVVVVYLYIVTLYVMQYRYFVLVMSHRICAAVNCSNYEGVCGKSSPGIESGVQAGVDTFTVIRLIVTRSLPPIFSHCISAIYMTHSEQSGGGYVYGCASIMQDRPRATLLITSHHITWKIQKQASKGLCF